MLKHNIEIEIRYGDKRLTLHASSNLANELLKLHKEADVELARIMGAEVSAIIMRIFEEDAGK